MADHSSKTLLLIRSLIALLPPLDVQESPEPSILSEGLLE
jgi:hypothetical protein